MSCATESVAAGLALDGTATRASRWLLVELGGRWGRDPVADTPLPDAVAAALGDFDGRVLFLRRPADRPAAIAVYRADSTEEGGTLRRLELGTLAEVGEADLDGGDPVEGPIVLVCSHGRRDPCCARLGPPTYDALQQVLDPERLWQSSHHGGHRFAANVLVLPWGVQLGRVDPAAAPRVAAAVREGRIPLDHYRGRTLYAPPVQAAEVALRRSRALDAVGALRLLDTDDGRVRFAVPDGEATLAVTPVAGPLAPASCGDEPAAASAFEVRVESDA